MPHSSKSSDLTQRDSDLVTVRLDSDNEYENRKVCIQPPLPDEDGDSDTTMMDALEIEPTAKQHQANEKYGGASAHTLEMPWRDSMNKLIKEMFLMNRAVVPQLLIIAILMKTASIAYAVHQPFINNAFFETAGGFVNHDVDQTFESDVVVEHKRGFFTHLSHVVADLLLPACIDIEALSRLLA